MKREELNFSTSAPGRVCLFGEHQDYLNLPVIPCAISLRINIEGKKQAGNQIHLDLPDIKKNEKFYVNRLLEYHTERDYFKSTMNVMQANNFTFSTGFEGIVNGEIPINSGTSSSSALIVAWVNLLAKISDQAITLPPEDIAAFAHQAEVTEFNEPGGKMDHYSCALGGTIFLDFEPELKVTTLKNSLKTIVLGDSGEPKSTTAILSRVKNGVLEIINKICKEESSFSLRNLQLEDVGKYENILTFDQHSLLTATLKNYQITLEAKQIFDAASFDHKAVGSLLTKHHDILNKDLNISTPKIEKMIEAALNAGAYGAKINGSGGGGCMFAYAPENPEEVAEAIISCGGKVYVVQPEDGVK
ncbi:MAG: GHMP kinase [Bacteroidetes bacterium]|nr:GHMP kinase [Bacteroidota bacterium]